MFIIVILLLITIATGVVDVSVDQELS